MPKIYRFATLIAMIFAVCALPALHFARWSTSMGSFTAELYDELVPITANNFIDLANSGFYNDLIFHRVIEGFVIQDGCPYGTGYGGPGYTIPDEINPLLHHNQAGILAMAKTSAPNSAGSQYYFTLAPQPSLDGNYAVFGKVVQGLDVVMAIGSVPTDANDKPITPVTIDTLRILDLSIGNTTPPTSEPYICNINEAQMFILEAFSDALVIEYKWYVDGVLQAGFGDFLFETTFNSPGTHTVVCNASNDDWSQDVTWDVDAQGSAVDDPVPPVSSVLEIVPNPLHDGASIKLHSLTSEAVAVSVYDLRGRHIRSSLDIVKSNSEWFWDGCNENGKRVPAGVYIVQARSDRGTVSKRCLVY